MSPAGSVAQSRAAQGLPPHVEDPATLAKIAALLNGSTGPAKPGATRSLTTLTTSATTTEGVSRGTV